MKKLLSVVLCVLMLAALLPIVQPHTASAETSGQCGDDLYWEYYSATLTLKITGSGAMYDFSGWQSEPWESKRAITWHLDLPDGLTYIGNNAFSWVMTESVSLPTNVTAIGDNSFNHCAKMEWIVIPDSVTSIGSSAFFQCDNLKNVYYLGTEEQREQIEIQDGNGCLIDKEWHYLSAQSIEILTLPQKTV